MKPKHSKSPWDLQHGTVIYGAKLNHKICIIEKTRDSHENAFLCKPNDEYKANAKLIVSAPELLEVLVDCLEYFENLEDADHDDDGFVPNEEMRLATIIKQVFEKAT